MLQNKTQVFQQKTSVYQVLIFPHPQRVCEEVFFVQIPISNSYCGLRLSILMSETCGALLISVTDLNVPANCNKNLLS